MSDFLFLSDVEKFFNSHKFDIDSSRVQNLFYVIERADELNNSDKKYVSHKTYEYEVEPEAFETICKICKTIYTRELDEGDKKKIYSEIVIAYNDFDKQHITLQPRIPFYIIVLDKLVV